MQVINPADNDFHTMRTFLNENGIGARGVMKEPLIYDRETMTLHITRYIRDGAGELQMFGDGAIPPGRFIVVERERAYCPKPPESFGITFSA